MPNYQEDWMPAPRVWKVKTIGDPAITAGMAVNNELIFEGSPLKLTRKGVGEWLSGATYTYDDLTDTLTVTKGGDTYDLRRAVTLTCTKRSGGVAWTAEEGG